MAGIELDAGARGADVSSRARDRRKVCEFSLSSILAACYPRLRTGGGINAKTGGPQRA